MHRAAGCIFGRQVELTWISVDGETRYSSVGLCFFLVYNVGEIGIRFLEHHFSGILLVINSPRAMLRLWEIREKYSIIYQSAKM